MPAVEQDLNLVLFVLMDFPFNSNEQCVHNKFFFVKVLF